MSAAALTNEAAEEWTDDDDIIITPSSSSTHHSLIGHSSSYPIIARNDLDIGRSVGVGSYGSVHVGVWRPRNISVALKKVFMLESEADILSQIRHRNIIQFFGVCETNPDFFIVTEYAENGSIYDYLHGQHATDMSFTRMLNWITEIARGLHYLHYEAPGATIIHRDIKSKNIVIDAAFICKLCDFGTSKQLSRSSTVPSWGGTAAWMSPEIINQLTGITTATDVWSYSVVLWEMLTREVPYDGLTEYRIYSMIAQDGVRLVIPDSCPKPLARLMHDCWKTEPKDRIDFKTILQELAMMNDDREFTNQCEQFVQHKDTWRHVIDEQLKDLKQVQSSLAIKSAELDRREKELKVREDSQRVLLLSHQWYYNSTHNSNVLQWDEDQVGCFVSKIVTDLHLGYDHDRIIGLISAIRHHNINGQRLLHVRPNDLRFFGISSADHRRDIFKQILALKHEYERVHSFPLLEESVQMLRVRKTVPKSPQQQSMSINLQMIMYQRKCTQSQQYRFKILVDSDWCDNADSIPIDIRNSHSIINDVCIVVLNHGNQSSMNGSQPPSHTFKLTAAPFGLIEWINVDSCNSDQSIIAIVSYTDRVQKPRNSRLRVQIRDFKQPQILMEKTVQLTIRPFCPSTTINSNYWQSSRTTTDNHYLQGVWRDRAANDNSPFRVAFNSDSSSMQSSSSKSPLWADIAAGIQRRRTTSIDGNQSVLTDNDNQIKSSSSDAAKTASINNDRLITTNDTHARRQNNLFPPSRVTFKLAPDHYRRSYSQKSDNSDDSNKRYNYTNSRHHAALANQGNTTDENMISSSKPLNVVDDDIYPKPSTTTASCRRKQKTNNKVKTRIHGGKDKWAW